MCQDIVFRAKTKCIQKALGIIKIWWIVSILFYLLIFWFYCLFGCFNILYWILVYMATPKIWIDLDSLLIIWIKVCSCFSQPLGFLFTKLSSFWDFPRRHLSADNYILAITRSKNYYLNKLWIPNYINYHTQSYLLVPFFAHCHILFTRS